MTKIAKFLFINDGENLGTCSIYAPFNEKEHTRLLKDTAMYCVSFDNDMLVESFKYSVRYVQIPDWLTEEEYANHRVSINYAYLTKVYGFTDDMGRDAFFALSGLSSHAKLIAVNLLKTKNFRSTFRKEMNDRLREWIATPEEERKYPTPFSHNQLHALSSPRTGYELDRIHRTRVNNHHVFVEKTDQILTSLI